jgi:hypothetical protein
MKTKWLLENYSAVRSLLKIKTNTMEAEATTETMMTDEVMTEQQPAAAAAMETGGGDDDAPPARLMITKMVRLSRTVLIAA